MQKYFYLIVLGVLLSHPVSAQYTIHVLNPWASDTCAGHADSLRMLGNNTVGYYPGSSLTPEGGNWFFYVYPTDALSFQFVDWCGPQAYQGSVSYHYSINLDSTLMKFPVGTNEIWIVIPDTSQKPIISNQPPAGNKVVYFLSPWDIGAPTIQFNGNSSIKMKMDTSIALCGWFKYYYYGKTDSAQVKFTTRLIAPYFQASESAKEITSICRQRWQIPTRFGSCRSVTPQASRQSRRSIPAYRPLVNGRSCWELRFETSTARNTRILTLAEPNRLVTGRTTITAPNQGHSKRHARPRRQTDAQPNEPMPGGQFQLVQDRYPRYCQWSGLYQCNVL